MGLLKFWVKEVLGLSKGEDIDVITQAAASQAGVKQELSPQ